MSSAEVQREAFGLGPASWPLATEGAAAVRAVRTQWRTRQLLDAAARLMERSGFGGVSMQALADEASVSVGLIYRYFTSKEELLLAVIVDVLEEFARAVPAAIADAGNDPVLQVAAAFDGYCRVIDRHRHAAVLTYRESRVLGDGGRRQIKDLEIRTIEPLRGAVREAVASGDFRPLDVDLFAYDLLLLAHAWALKHWYFAGTLTLEAYVHKQTALCLRAAIEPCRAQKYAALLGAATDDLLPTP